MRRDQEQNQNAEASAAAVAAKGEPPQGGLADAVQRRKGTFLASMKAVFWSFFGVRKNSHSTEDEARLNPLHVVFAALLAGFIFIAVLIIVVKIVLAKMVT